MRTLGTKVLGEHTDSTPVGGQIVDLQARIANLKASEKAIQAIMDKATTIADVLTVQQRLAEVQGQIEELSGQTSGPDRPGGLQHPDSHLRGAGLATAEPRLLRRAPRLRLERRR